MEVSAKVRLPVRVQQVWETVGEFKGLANWHPVIATLKAENEGQRRRLALPDGSEVVEDLVSHNDSDRTYTYRIADAGPLPVRAYESTIKVENAGDGQSVVIWSAQFEPVGNETVAEQTVKRIYEVGLENLKTLFRVV